MHRSDTVSRRVTVSLPLCSTYIPSEEHVAGAIGSSLHINGQAPPFVTGLGADDARFRRGEPTAYLDAMPITQRDSGGA